MNISTIHTAPKLKGAVFLCNEGFADCSVAVSVWKRKLSQALKAPSGREAKLEAKKELFYFSPMRPVSERKAAVNSQPLQKACRRDNPCISFNRSTNLSTLSRCSLVSISFADLCATAAR